MKAIAKGITPFTTLTHLVFWDNQIGHEGAMEIVQLISERKLLSLELLSLSNTNIGDKAIQCLAKSMLDTQTSKSIKDLDMYNVGATDRGVCAISELINKCPCLEYLVFDWLPQTKHESMVVFFQALSRNVTVREFICFSKDIPLQLVDDCFDVNSTITSTDGIPYRYATLNEVCNSLNASMSLGYSLFLSSHGNRFHSNSHHIFKMTSSKGVFPRDLRGKARLKHASKS
jgi:hypothetical protein